MRYKKWSWICLAIFIISVCLYFLFSTSKEKRRIEYEQQLAQYELEYQRRQKIIGQYDSIRNRNEEMIEEVIDFHMAHLRKEAELNRPYGYGTSTTLYEDSIRIREELETEFQEKIIQFQRENDPGAIERPKEPQQDSFNLISGSASIISLVASVFFRICDNKKKKKTSSANSSLNQESPLSVEPLKSQTFFELSEEYNGYMTAITYTNCGDEEARNVSVNVEQNENETVSLTVIKNDDLFPVEMLNIGDSFEIEVECYYPKAYRYFTVEWEDNKGKHTQRNRVQLSKNYEV